MSFGLKKILFLLFNELFDHGQLFSNIHRTKKKQKKVSYDIANT